MDGGAVARGDEGGLKAYFLRERPMLLRLLTARLGNVEEADDVLQDVWLRLETMTSPPISQPAGYLFRIANNLAIDRRRAAAYRSQRERHWADIHGEASVAPPEDAMIAASRLREIDAIVAALPDRTARIFRLYRYEHQPRRTIAETIGISVSAIEKHLQTAYRAIHHLSDAERDDGTDTSGTSRSGARVR